VSIRGLLLWKDPKNTPIRRPHPAMAILRENRKSLSGWTWRSTSTC